MPTDTSLFRPDAISYRYQRSDGPPLQLGHSPWRWSSLLLAACALGVILFLWLGEYTRKARAMGQLVPVAGLLRVHAPQAGTLASLAVHEGQHVQAGQVLLRLYSDRAVAGGEVQQQVLRQLDARSQSLQQSRQTLAALYAARRAEARHKMAQLQSQLDGLIRQTALAQSRSALAGKALQRQQQLVAEGFVSAASLEDKQAELMQADGQVAALQAAQAEVARLLASAGAEAQQLPLAADNENRSLGRDLSARASAPSSRGVAKSPSLPRVAAWLPHCKPAPARLLPNRKRCWPLYRHQPATRPNCTYPAVISALSAPAWR
jgi:membrane fusion protein